MHPDLAVLESATASTGYAGKAAGDGAMFTVAKGSQVSELTLPGGLAGGDDNVFWMARAGCRLTMRI